MQGMGAVANDGMTKWGWKWLRLYLGYTAVLPAVMTSNYQEHPVVLRVNYSTHEVLRLCILQRVTTEVTRWGYEQIGYLALRNPIRSACNTTSVPTTPTPSTPVPTTPTPST
eukprot:Sspe_Gene.38195::Locus_18414_Transcript_5_7_Confidence_0.696_Length_659::g.38195::m.38195